ncbi:ABC transporter ATP-binding protein [Aliifodinibius sp. S!AR15-10]|uniref:ABC transporter ATP-binding protein n=1 Tax=Aliifodinibius sp. S!AR15-10 TaxID=2950437 RepID=UPI0028642D8F|nr:ABC transporter ATP-binding protein [Aliifodinibius sp. S!AR15-10]MDR8391420.1 ABC transporter ATP-binding protein [Aliifodinibius sp. S!AR15-10]
MRLAIEINGLQKSYGNTPVLEDFDLAVPSGTIFGLIGPNGAGKSTLIGILIGMLDYDEGRVTINGLPLSEENELEIKRQVATVLQPPLLFEHFTSHDFLHYICDVYGIGKDARKGKMDSLLDYLGLSKFEHTKIDKLSAGSRKKLSFCAAVLSDPQILFLDEPFESIDVISIGRMKTILNQLKKNGVTIIITSHILEIVENLCDDIAILHNQKIIAYLDSNTRKELKEDTSLNEIFEHYVQVEHPKDDVLKWL